MRKFRAGRVMGIPVDLHVSLLVFLPFLAWRLASPVYVETWADILAAVTPLPVETAPLLAGTTPWVVGGVGAVALFAGVLLHELGHSWVALRYGIGIDSITLWLFGGVAHLEALPPEWRTEFWIAVAGPAVSLALGALAFAPLYVLPAGTPVLAFLLGWFALTNVSLAVFNLLPAFPMDGGRVLRALLARTRPYVDATRTAVRVARVIAALLAVVGLLSLNLVLVLLAGFVYLAAGSEATLAVTRDLLETVPVRELVRPVTATVRSDASVAHLVDRMLREGRAEFVVVAEDDTVVGVATVESLRDVPLSASDRTVGEVIAADPPVVDVDDSAAALLSAFGRGAGCALVADGGRVVGLVSQSDFWRALALLRGAGDAAPTSPLVAR